MREIRNRPHIKARQSKLTLALWQQPLHRQKVAAAVSLSTKHQWRTNDAYRVHMRTVRALQHGIASPGWQGGKSFEPYTPLFNRQLKEQVRVRDNFHCQVCAIPELELSERLHIHHIDYDKKNSDIANLISLCRRCHLRALLYAKESSSGASQSCPL